MTQDDPTNIDSERALVEAALASASGYSAFQKNLSPLVDKIIEHYLDYGVSKDELRPIAWTYLRFALEKYGDRLKEQEAKGQQTYKFSTYFSWWIKTSIETYLGITDEPLNKITKRIAPKGNHLK